MPFGFSQVQVTQVQLHKVDLIAGNSSFLFQHLKDFNDRMNGDLDEFKKTILQIQNMSLSDEHEMKESISSDNEDDSCNNFDIMRQFGNTSHSRNEEDTCDEENHAEGYIDESDESENDEMNLDGTYN